MLMLIYIRAHFYLLLFCWALSCRDYKWPSRDFPALRGLWRLSALGKDSAHKRRAMSKWDRDRTERPSKKGRRAQSEGEGAQPAERRLCPQDRSYCRHSGFATREVDLSVDNICFLPSFNILLKIAIAWIFLLLLYREITKRQQRFPYAPSSPQVSALYTATMYYG